MPSTIEIQGALTSALKAAGITGQLDVRHDGSRSTSYVGSPQGDDVIVSVSVAPMWPRKASIDRDRDVAEQMARVFDIQVDGVTINHVVSFDRDEGVVEYIVEDRNGQPLLRGDHLVFGIARGTITLVPITETVEVG